VADPAISLDQYTAVGLEMLISTGRLADLRVVRQTRLIAFAATDAANSSVAGGQVKMSRFDHRPSHRDDLFRGQRF
jgi:hypothetical protein